MQIIVAGLVMGCIYALAALGLVLIFRTTGVVNFAHGEMAMVTTFVSYIFLASFDLPYLVSLLLALIFAAIMGFILYWLVMKRVQSAPHLNQVVLTLGLFMILNGIAGLVWGYHPSPFPEAITAEPLHFWGIYISKHELFIVGVTVLLMTIFFLLFRYTKMGLATRAASQDIKTSELMGIKVTRVFNGVWIAAAVLGGIAGMLTAPMTFLSPNMMLDILVFAFAAAVLGGFMNLGGAVLGALMIGVLENMVSYYIDPNMKVICVFLLIILVLYIRPQGIFGGAKIVKKV